MPQTQQPTTAPYDYQLGTRAAARAAALDCSRWLRRHRPAMDYLFMCVRKDGSWYVEIPAGVMADDAAQSAMMDICSQHA